MTLLFRDVTGPLRAPRGAVVCVGAFDGVHIGHRALLARARERASARSADVVAISFEPIPREFFARVATLPRIATPREKFELLSAAGADQVGLLRFDSALASMSAESFIEDVLIARVGMREILVGADFRFGHSRRGDVAMLREAGARCGFAVDIVESIDCDGARVSSSAVRALLAADNFAAAARMLDRAFSIGGHVVRGQQLGRKLGYPTANIRLGRRVAPIGGIFAVRVHGVTADAMPGVASLGVRPTVTGAGEPLLEAHLFDFDGDLYGRRITVEFVAKLRDEEKFADIATMVAQIDRDADAARTILAATREARRSDTKQDKARLRWIEYAG